MILSTWHLEDLADDAEWIATELVTNAVQHGRGSPRLSVCRKDSGIEIAVFDSSRALPQVRNATVQDEGGRGLRIVDNLSSRWGVDTLRGGKRVWAMLNC
jgi:two-component sensor histidine kinase